MGQLWLICVVTVSQNTGFTKCFQQRQDTSLFLVQKSILEKQSFSLFNIAHAIEQHDKFPFNMTILLWCTRHGVLKCDTYPFFLQWLWKSSISPASLQRICLILTTCVALKSLRKAMITALSLDFLLKNNSPHNLFCLLWPTDNVCCLQNSLPMGNWYQKTDICF